MGNLTQGTEANRNVYAWVLSYSRKREQRSWSLARNYGCGQPAETYTLWWV